MILLKKVRLINWYGFSNVTAPIGFFTLIAGKNGNGKSVLLDAVKYAAYGDTVFNKSSESKGSRTLSSYTRGLLDATAGTYMRPADRVPNVYSHIVLEYFDDVGFQLEQEIAANVYPDLCSATQPQRLVQEGIASGKTGLAAGQGLYDWSKKDLADYKMRKQAPYFNGLDWDMPV